LHIADLSATPRRCKDEPTLTALTRIGAAVNPGIVGTTLGFATSYHALTGQRPAGFGNNGMLALIVVIVVKVNNHPVACAIELMCPCGVRANACAPQCGEPPCGGQ
jgi:hypothetical protein